MAIISLKFQLIAFLEWRELFHSKDLEMTGEMINQRKEHELMFANKMNARYEEYLKGE